MRRIIKTIVLILCCIICISCSNKEKIKTEQIYAFNTTIDISITSSKDNLDEACQKIKELLYLYSDLCDCYSEKDFNNIYTINHTNEFVEVDSHLINLLKKALLLQTETNGYFNILIGEVSNIYKELIKTSDLSLLNGIEDKVSDMNSSTIEIVDNTVKRVGNATIDLGGIAKGYALKEVEKVLKEYEITTYLINAGYSSILLGSKSGKDYKVGLRYTKDTVLNLQNMVVTTSSIEEQKVVIDGNVYHHLVNPKTGYCENKYSTIYLVGSDACMLDAYSTAFFSMDLEDIKRLCEAKNIKYIIYNNTNLLASNN